MSDDLREDLRKAVAGDRDALRTLLQQYGPALRDQIAREIGPAWQSSFDADDVMQVTYMEAFLHQHALMAESTSAFESWLGRIARNNLRDAIKELSRQKRPNPKQRIQAGPASDDSLVMLLEVLSDGGETPSRHVARGEAARVLQALIERLPADYAQVIRGIDLEGHSVREIAEHMGRSAGAIHMLRSRAHDRLRSLIGEETDFFSRPS